MTKKLTAILFSVLLPGMALSMQKELVSSGESFQQFLPELKDITNLPRYCITLAVALSNVPIGNYRGMFKPSKVIKVIRWEDLVDGFICECMSTEARKFNKDAWLIRCFAIGKEKGLELPISDCLTPCPLQQLEDAYKKVIEELQTGWKFTTLKCHPSILLTNSEKDWYLFIKETNSCWDCLIRCIAGKFGLYKPNSSSDQQHVVCYDRWVMGYGSTYLWVKKESFKKVKEVLQFKLSVPDVTE